MFYSSRKTMIVVLIDSEGMRKDMAAAGYSIRSLSSKIKVSRKTISKWLKRGEMPLYLVRLISNTIHPKTKTIWVRVGMTIPVTDDELFDFIEQSYEATDRTGFADCDISETEMSHLLERGYVDGESYIPGVCFNDNDNWFMEERERRKNLYEED